MGMIVDILGVGSQNRITLTKEMKELLEFDVGEEIIASKLNGKVVLESEESDKEMICPLTIQPGKRIRLKDAVNDLLDVEKGNKLLITKLPDKSLMLEKRDLDEE